MSKHQQKFIQPLTGQFLGWGEDCPPHRYIKLATASGDRIAKVAKSLRPLIQDWQPGMWLSLMSQNRVDLDTGETKIKVVEILTPGVDRLAPAVIDFSSGTHSPSRLRPTQIRVCQGSSCRRRGSEGICQVMQTHLDRHELTDRVKIEPVKCLHQCKAAPHAIVLQPSGSSSEKTHYRQIQPCQVEKIIDRHFSTTSLVKPSENELVTQIGNYLQQIGSTMIAI
jgi:(2Fe-2S) ferredoxin